MCHNGDGPHKAKGLCLSCYKKSRRVYSERTLPKQHVLMPDDVREIRSMYGQGFSQAELAAKFGVSGPTVWSVVHRKTWRGVE